MSSWRALHRALSSNATTDGGDEEDGVNAALIVSLTLGGARAGMHAGLRGHVQDVHTKEGAGNNPVF